MQRIDWDQVGTKREQALFALILVVFMIFFFQVVIGSKWEDLKQNQARLGDLSMERNALAKFIQTTPTLPRIASAPSSQNIKLKVLSGEIASPFVGLPSLLTQLTDSSLLQGVRIESLSFQAPISEPGFTRTDFFVEILGSFHELIVYLARLEQFPALFEIKDIVVSATEGKPGVIHAEITCRFFNRRGTEAGEKKS